MEEEGIKKVKKRVFVKSLLLATGGFFLVCFLTVYVFGIQNLFLKKFATTFRLPAAIVENKLVTFNELEKRGDSVRNFYENQDFSDLGLRVDFSTPDGRKRLEVKRKQVLEKLIEEKLIEKEARSRGITLDREVLDQEVSRKIREYSSGGTVEENLKKLYGWNLEDFKVNIVKPDILLQRILADEISKSEDFSNALEKIKEAEEELASGKDFSEVAKKYSEGESASRGGDLGWFSLKQMVPEAALAVVNMEKGKTSGIFQSSLGFHIIKLEDKKREGEVDLFKLRQVFVRAQSPLEMIGRLKKNSRVFVLVSGWKWNKEDARIEFSSSSLADFEKDLEKNSQNDISVMFR